MAAALHDAPQRKFFRPYRYVSGSAETARIAASVFSSRLCCSRLFRTRGYHFVQLALVIGLFACGGLICSMLFVDGSDNFLGPRYWPRKSYSSPALATPQRPMSAPTVPQNGQFKSNDEEKTAALQERRVGDRKTSTSPLSLASAAQNSVLRR